MKKIILFALKSKFLAKILILPTLKLHTLCYKLAGIFSITLSEDGNHPKHKILKYKEWFCRQISHDDVVLDIGCNTGSLARFISTKAKKVYGIDIVKKHIKKAKEHSCENNIKFIYADATTYDFNTIDAADTVVLSNVLEHIEKRVDFLLKLKTNLIWNNRKKLLIRVPMRDREWITIYKKDLGLDYRLDKTHFTEYTEIEFREEMEKAGIIINSLNISFGEIYAVCSF